MSLGVLPSLGWDQRAVKLFADVLAETPGPGLLPGRVVRVEHSACVVALPDRDQVALAPLGVAVGDWVAVRADQGESRVVAMGRRWSELTRLDPSGRIQVLAANVDLVLITTPADRLNPARVEREMAMAWDSGTRPVVLVTKSDRAAEGDIARLAARLVHVDLVVTSAVDGTGLASVGALLQPCRTAVLIGPSGAGKSSLANALIGADRLSIGAVRPGDHRGRHTTTTRQLVAVPQGGVLIDTPGLRSLALTGDGAGVDAAFGDIEEIASRCRFRDCRHDREPGCAVLAAVQDGALDPARWASYDKLKREVARADPRARQEMARKWKAQTKGMRSHAKKR